MSRAMPLKECQCPGLCLSGNAGVQGYASQGMPVSRAVPHGSFNPPALFLMLYFQWWRLLAPSGGPGRGVGHGTTWDESSFGHSHYVL